MTLFIILAPFFNMSIKYHHIKFVEDKEDESIYDIFPFNKDLPVPNIIKKNYPHDHANYLSGCDYDSFLEYLCVGMGCAFIGDEGYEMFALIINDSDFYVSEFYKLWETYCPGTDLAQMTSDECENIINTEHDFLFKNI